MTGYSSSEVEARENAAFLFQCHVTATRDGDFAAAERFEALAEALIGQVDDVQRDNPVNPDTRPKSAAEKSPAPEVLWLRDFMADPDVLKPPTAIIPHQVWPGRITVAGRPVQTSCTAGTATT